MAGLAEEEVRFQANLGQGSLSAEGRAYTDFVIGRDSLQYTCHWLSSPCQNDLLYGEAVPARSTSVSSEANNWTTGPGLPLPTPNMLGTGRWRQPRSAPPAIEHSIPKRSTCRCVRSGSARQRGRSSILNQHQLQSSCFWRTMAHGWFNEYAFWQGRVEGTGQASEGGTVCKISLRFFNAKIGKYISLIL